MQIKIALWEHGHADIVKECVKKCIEDGHAWVAASLSLELLRKGRLDVGSALDLTMCCLNGSLQTALPMFR